MTTTFTDWLRNRGATRRVVYKGERTGWRWALEHAMVCLQQVEEQEGRQVSESALWLADRIQSQPLKMVVAHAEATYQRCLLNTGEVVPTDFLAWADASVPRSIRHDPALMAAWPSRPADDVLCDIVRDLPWLRAEGVSSAPDYLAHLRARGAHRNVIYATYSLKVIYEKHLEIKRMKEEQQ